MTLARIALQASYTPADNRIVIDKFLMFGGNLSASLTGEVDLFPGETPKIALNGHIAPLDVANLLHYWPLQLGQGAREWIAANILGGTIGPMALKADIAAGALDLPVLPDGAINLSFPIANATVNYLQGLTPLTNMQGSATLTGDTFTATVTSAKIGPLALSGGSVTIPNLHVAGSPGNIVAHVDGALSDVLTLIDMPPLHYPTRFHIGTGSAKGQAAIDLSFRVPMVKDLGIDDVGIKIGGQVRGNDARFGGGPENPRGGAGEEQRAAGPPRVSTPCCSAIRPGATWYRSPSTSTGTRDGAAVRATRPVGRR